MAYCPKLIKVVVSYSKQSKYHYLTSSLKKLGRYVGRGKNSSIAQAAVENRTLRPKIAVKLAAHVRRHEIVPICSDNHDSLLRLKSKPAVELPGKNICVSERLHALSCTRPRVTLNALIFASSTRYISASITH